MKCIQPTPLVSFVPRLNDWHQTSMIVLEMRAAYYEEARCTFSGGNYFKFPSWYDRAIFQALSLKSLPYSS